MDSEKFSLDYNNIQIKGDCIPAGSNPNLLILHGGGTANISRYEKLRTLLAETGIASCAFDSPGHGETGGPLEGSSLIERTEAAFEVIKYLKLPLKTVIGSSMGAYTAIRLLEHHDIQNLILFVPAIYSDESYELPFGEQFKAAISKSSSWRDSRAWELLASFKGRLLVVQAEHDEVVPAELVDKVYAAAVSCSHKEKYILKGAPHGFTRHLNDNPEQLKVLTDKVVSSILA